MKNLLRRSAVVVLVSFMCFSAIAAQRTAIFISDTHFGVGKDVAGNWDPTEDFRWPGALHGFLQYLTQQYPGPVDLVMLGDFLELWQPPANIPCIGHGPNLGCTVDEAAAIAAQVVREHASELQELKGFSQQGDNRLYVVPGNHDSALLEASVWAPLSQALDLASGRVVFRDDGLWTSADGTVLAEHGHQIGADLNRFDQWPVVARVVDGQQYMIQPWGEQFVQRLFNATEREYPIIDNVSPESVGAKYRYANRKVMGTVADLARFIAFNLFETSIIQKIHVLGDDAGHDQQPAWDIPFARSQGYKLFSDSLAEDDPFRSRIVEQGGDGDALRTQLTALAQQLSDEDVEQLCAHLAARNAKTSCLHTVQGALIQMVINTKRGVLSAHLRGRLQSHPKVLYFVYAHTHQLEEPWAVRLSGARKVMIANTGAFQRTIDETGFKALLASKGVSEDEALKKIALEDLPACYTFVAIAYGRMETLRWFQTEIGPGHVVKATSAECR
jgi:UDP-2,3-diacylglucosamine pyrophosphatase LpxH